MNTFGYWRKRPNRELTYLSRPACAAALICFDYCLTFCREVDLVWKRGISVSTVLFYAARYPALFSTIFVILGVLPPKSGSFLVSYA